MKISIKKQWEGLPTHFDKSVVANRWICDKRCVNKVLTFKIDLITHTILRQTCCVHFHRIRENYCYFIIT